MTLPMLTPLALSIALAAPSSPPGVELKIDVEPLVENSGADDPENERELAEETRDFTTELLSKALEENGVAVADTDAEATVAVTLDWVNYLDSHYEVTIDLTYGGKTQRIADGLECELCDGPKVAGLVAGQSAKIAQALKAGDDAADPPPDNPPPEDPPPEDPPSETTPKGKAMGPLGYTGIALTVAGIGTGIGGGVLLARGEQQSLDGERGQLKVENFRPAGIGLAATGGALLVTGVALLIVDQTVGRKRRDREAVQKAHGSFAPTLGPDRVGISAIVRF